MEIKADNNELKGQKEEMQSYVKNLEQEKERHETKIMITM